MIKKNMKDYITKKGHELFAQNDYLKRFYNTMMGTYEFNHDEYVIAKPEIDKFLINNTGWRLESNQLGETYIWVLLNIKDWE